MDTVDLCSESETSGSPRHEIQEYDFVGSLSNSPTHSDDVTIIIQSNGSPSKPPSDFSEDTVEWQSSSWCNGKSSPHPAALHNMSASSDDNEDSNSKKFNPSKLGVISLDSDDETEYKPSEKSSPSRNVDFMGLNNPSTSENNIYDKEVPVNPWCPSYDFEDNMMLDVPSTASSSQTISSSGVSSMGSQNEEKKGKRKSREDKENTEKEKVQRKKMLITLKALKPGECMKYITMECCDKLVQTECFGRVAEVVGATGVMVSPQRQTSCITWTRRLPPHLQEQQGELRLSPSASREPHLVVVLQQSQVVELLKNRSLSTHLASLRRTSNSTQGTLTLILYGMENYLRKHRNKTKAKWKEHVRGDGAGRGNTEAHITENDLDYYIAKLLLDDGISCCRVETADEFAYTLLSFTKAIAEAPFKRDKYEQDLQADFYMRGDNRDCVKVDAQGNGLLRLWSQSLCKFPQAGLEVGQAVCRACQSPAALSDALVELKGGITEAATLLGEIPVRRDRDPMAGTKRLGPELAKKLYTYFTATSGDTPLS